MTRFVSIDSAVVGEKRGFSPTAHVQVFGRRRHEG
jgi:hypothetical protein